MFSLGLRVANKVLRKPGRAKDRGAEVAEGVEDAEFEEEALETEELEGLAEEEGERGEGNVEGEDNEANESRWRWSRNRPSASVLRKVVGASARRATSTFWYVAGHTPWGKIARLRGEVTALKDRLEAEQWEFIEAMAASAADTDKWYAMLEHVGEQRIEALLDLQSLQVELKDVQVELEDIQVELEDSRSEVAQAKVEHEATMRGAEAILQATRGQVCACACLCLFENRDLFGVRRNQSSGGLWLFRRFLSEFFFYAL